MTHRIYQILVTAITIGVLPISSHADMIITSDGKVGTVIHSDSNPPEKPSKEQIMLDRIAILEKAQNSTDPDILAMAEQVRADIAKDKASQEEKIAHPVRWWIKHHTEKLIFALILISIFAMIFGWIHRTNKEIEREQRERFEKITDKNNQIIKSLLK